MSVLRPLLSTTFKVDVQGEYDDKVYPSSVNKLGNLTKNALQGRARARIIVLIV